MEAHVDFFPTRTSAEAIFSLFATTACAVVFRARPEAISAIEREGLTDREQGSIVGSNIF